VQIQGSGSCLDLVDDDSIRNSLNVPLEELAPERRLGQTYQIDPIAPFVQSITAPILRI
jgi:hypothetical protein